MTVEVIWLAVLYEQHIGVQSNYVMCGWPLMKSEVQKEVQPYWSFRD